MESATSENRCNGRARGGGYGLDEQLAKNAANNYDYVSENEARDWIEKIIKEEFPSDFATSLKDGVILCKLINCIVPNSIKKIHSSSMPFKQMENVSNFLRACRRLGVNEVDLFETVDLFEMKDISLVVRCIHALGRAVQKNFPDNNGPTLGVKEATANPRKFSSEQLAQSNAYASKISLGISQSMNRFDIGVVHDGVTFASQVSTGLKSQKSVQPSSRWTKKSLPDEMKNVGSNVDVREGSEKENQTSIPPVGQRSLPPLPPTERSPLGTSSTNSGRSPWNTSSSNVERTPSSSLKANHLCLSPQNRTAQLHHNHNPNRNHSITPEYSTQYQSTAKEITQASPITPSVAIRRPSATSATGDEDVKEWISLIVGEPVEGDIGDCLKDGVILCKLVNAIKPGSVKKIELSKMPFKQMENISNFLKAIRAIGVLEFDLFETVDLFEQKDIRLVIKCLYALGRTVQKNFPDFDGPTLGVKEATLNRRKFSPHQLAQANACVSRLNLGSSQTMGRTHISNSATVTFGYDAARS